MSSQAWHALSPETVLQRLESHEAGLSRHEARRRYETDGANTMPGFARKSLWRRFVEQLRNVLIYVLIAAAVITALLGHWVDTGVIAAVVVVNALIGVIQEGRAEKALDAIRQMLSQQALVRREGKHTVVDAAVLVPGDIVTIRPGDKVPADIRLIRTKELRIDEAVLTGESAPVRKQVEAVEASSTLGDMRSLAYSGTLVTSGQGEGVVVETGRATQIGRISEMLREVGTLQTPLLRQIDRLAGRLSVAVVAVAAVTFVFGVLIRGYGAEAMFMAAVGLAVAAIPEGLPAIMTITLAIGVRAMASQQAIIRRLAAVETLGSVGVICSDKTGTFTRNEMTAVSVALANRSVSVSGSGYDPHGAFGADGHEVDPDDPALRALCRAALLCNDARIEAENDGYRVIGDPSEGALVVLALKAGFEPAHADEAYPRTDVIPFESEQQLMATLHHDHDGHAFICVKGAPERLFDRCITEHHGETDRPFQSEGWATKAETIASQGQRLMAIAVKTVDPQVRELRFDAIESGLCLLGLVGMIDPPRPEAIEAVGRCIDAGIRVKMITGDHALTAAAVARQLGIEHAAKALSGAELAEASDAQLRRMAMEYDVFARTSPEQKLRLVEAMQHDATVVAMTGDGVNDAPALKRADVGIAMGRKGTEVAKEASDMVLADDNFASIAAAVREGRVVYDNLKKTILFILPTNGGEALILIAAIVLGRMLPITPVQILWINMITAVTLALALAFEPAEGDVMQRRPRRPDESLLGPFVLWRIGFVASIMTVGTFGLFVYFREAGASIELARTVAVNTLVAFEVFYLFGVRHLNASIFSTERANRHAVTVTLLLVGFQLLFTYADVMQALFETVGLGWRHWAMIIGVGSSVLVLVELEKWWLRRRGSGA